MFHWTFLVAIALSPIVLAMFIYLVVLFAQKTKIKIQYDNKLEYKSDAKYKKIDKLTKIFISVFSILIIVALVLITVGIGNTYFIK